MFEISHEYCNYCFIYTYFNFIIDEDFVKYLLKRKKCRKRVVFRKVKE